MRSATADHVDREVARLAGVLYGHGSGRVWLFGSLAQRHRPDRLSDIDLAVEGLAPDAFGAARLDVVTSAACKVDVVRLESAPSDLRWAIRRSGRVISPSEGPSKPQATWPMRTTTTSLQRQRTAAVVAQFRARSVARVLDLGCGRGDLVAALWEIGEVASITGGDLDADSLDAARRRIDRLRRDGPGPDVSFVRASATSAHPRFAGHDAVALVEVIEHLSPTALEAVASTTLGGLQPSCVVVTTPNAECNPLLGAGRAGPRHRGHRFEWTRAEAAAWADDTARRFGYAMAIGGIGPDLGEAGRPTTLLVFDR